MTQAGMPKAVLQVAAIELDCTMQPMKPRARMMAHGKEAREELAEPAPVNAVRDVVDRTAVNGAVAHRPSRVFWASTASA